jgi:hypothetical protein
MLPTTLLAPAWLLPEGSRAAIERDTALKIGHHKAPSDAERGKYAQWFALTPWVRGNVVQCGI